MIKPDEGCEWRTYMCSFETVEGTCEFKLIAMSLEHAATMLDDIKSTARLDGEFMQMIH